MSQQELCHALYGLAKSKHSCAVFSRSIYCKTQTTKETPNAWTMNSSHTIRSPKDRKATSAGYRLGRRTSPHSCRHQLLRNVGWRTGSDWVQVFLVLLFSLVCLFAFSLAVWSFIAFLPQSHISYSYLGLFPLFPCFLICYICYISITLHFHFSLIFLACMFPPPWLYPPTCL